MTVFGYTDNQAIRTARFPSNFELSQARADAVADRPARPPAGPGPRSPPRASGETNPDCPPTPRRKDGSRTAGPRSCSPAPRTRCEPHPLPRLIRSRWFRTGFAVIVSSWLLVWFLGPAARPGGNAPARDRDRPHGSPSPRCSCSGSSRTSLHDAGRQPAATRRSRPASPKPRRKPEGGRGAHARKPSAPPPRRSHSCARPAWPRRWQALRKSKLGGSRKHLAVDALVYDHRAPRRRQDDRAAELRPAFPARFGQARQPMAGVGGTRNCEWMFTDEAVLIDTAGRYTTQDSAEAGRQRRVARLPRLAQEAPPAPAAQRRPRRHQPQRPVRSRPRPSGRAHCPRYPPAACGSCTTGWACACPSTCCSPRPTCCPGFSEFFDNMGKEERDQVWGMTFPLDDEAGDVGATGEAGAVAGSSRRSSTCCSQRLNDRACWSACARSPTSAAAGLIYGFPQQVASLRDARGRRSSTEAFQPSRLEARPLLRGVYITSGTQDGTPIDRLLRRHERPSSACRARLPPRHSGPGRSYFLSAPAARGHIRRGRRWPGWTRRWSAGTKWVSAGAPTPPARLYC